ncbi:cellulose biosynthesis cyclic di-GMP-binding regulatory protein BcsB [Clostridium frigidicarnis]|uniref:Cellulose synthase subunit n=1 Tax=Clostridium frigidicarnis TaxID=84698 RepID=A0A1I0XXP0_9CLOT|nr:cellulose biosynthesis cyclic di-GMP-binding regulatory protein BcsB [Clostridium frigidicarnis]SFB05825.1 cellulose synthase subunit [Clostridium frigidicarnis]
MKKFISVLLGIVILFSTNVYGAVDYEESINTKEFNFVGDMESIGVNSSKTFYVDIDKEWDATNCFLNLVFTQSELLDEKESTLTIDVNGLSISSVKLAGRKNYKEEVKIPIKKEYLRDGSNEIKIKTYRRITDKICTDDVNTGNWIVLHKESYVHLDFKNIKDTDALEEYPYPYVKSSDAEGKVNIIIPDNYTEGELSSAMVLSSNFGSRYKNKKIGIDIRTVSTINDIEDENLIYIGKKDNITEDITNLITDEEKNSIINGGIVKEVISPFNNSKKMLLILGSNDDTLLKNIKFLANKDLISQVSKNSIYIDDELDVDDIEKEEKDKLYFKDLNYGDINLKGPFSQEYDLNCNIPKDRIVQGGSKIVLNTRYSKNIDFDNSVATLYINSIPIGSKKLSEENSDEDIMEFSIPEGISEKNYYDLKIRFDLELKDSFCDARGADTPWAFISRDSYIYTKYKKRQEAAFNTYPFPFVQDGELKDSAIVVPDNPTNKDLSRAASIMEFMGNDVKNNNVDIKVVKSSQIDNELKNLNLIVIGTPQNNSLIKELNNSSKIKFDESFNRFVSNDKIKLTDSYGENISVLQFIKSPYNNNKQILEISSAKEDGLENIQKYMNDNSFMEKINGDVAIIDASGEIKNINTSSELANASENKSKKDVFNEKTIFFIVITSFMIILIITGTILMIKKYKAHSKK